jgi:hypothetical protein
MNSSTASPRKRLWLLSPAAALLLMTGCIPVAWLPDSSGFLYVSQRVGGKKLDVILYDVASGKKRTVVHDLPATTPCPALSPDGKRFAVARLARNSKQYEMEVVVYDLQGKEVHRSPLIAWRKLSEFEVDDQVPTILFWARTRETLIVAEIGHPSTGIYDLKQKALTKLEGEPCIVGGSPVRPDDRGFLLKSPLHEKLWMSLVDWKGKEQTIAIGEELAPFVALPYIYTSAWDRNVAVITREGDQARIDTEKKTSSVEKAPKDPLEGTVISPKLGPPSIQQRYDFAGKGARVRVVAGTRLTYLLLWKPGAEKPEKVFVAAGRGGDFGSDGSITLSPSPDGKWLVARGTGDRLEPPADFLLIGHDGKLRIERREEEKK